MAVVPNNGAAFLGPDTLVVIKISVNDSLKKLKLPLRDLGANVLLGKLRHSLKIDLDQRVLFERFSDSAGGYIELDPNNAQVFKTLLRAAKAKLKLRLKATFLPPLLPPVSLIEESPEEQPAIRGSSTLSPLPSSLPLHGWDVPRVIAHEAQSLLGPLAPPPPPAMAPVIVSSPKFHDGQRESTALDSRSVGNGIFEFRDAQISKQKPSVDPEQTDTNTSGTAEAVWSKLAATLAKEMSSASTLQRPTSEICHGSAWSVYCNECDAAMADAHYHCNICDTGDYDLCESCVAAGKLCPGEGHWLIKRFIKDGNMVTSTTERLSPRGKPSVDRAADEIDEDKACPPPLQALADLEKAVHSMDLKHRESEVSKPAFATRTCNSCIQTNREDEFVTCVVCDDFDLCIRCHTADKHGHHPAHAFEEATSKTNLTWLAKEMLNPGRRVRHNAICDGCDNKIVGVRHKCLTCPDYDYCSNCVVDARSSHPRHRFAPLYEPIPDNRTLSARHIGIFCDGPLCNGTAGQSYITGTRYKCAVCHDTDFCASCEASPSNTHNRTHPLIMFKTAVRGVSISTINEGVDGAVRALGDRGDAGAYYSNININTTKTASADTSSVSQANTTTQVQTVAEIKPTARQSPVELNATRVTSDTTLYGTFVCDNVADGTEYLPGDNITQVWTMRNPGPTVWPAGCSVRFVGGDNMLNIDNNHPCSLADINDARETNVVAREVLPGENVAFRITLRAPEREGAHISYWRLRSPDGTPFGHRLWCDIKVISRDDPKAVPRVLNGSTEAAIDALPKSSMAALEPHKKALMQLEQQNRERLLLLRQQQQLAIQRQRLFQQQAEVIRKYPTPTALQGYNYDEDSYYTYRKPQIPGAFSVLSDGSFNGESAKNEAGDQRVWKDSAKQRVESIRARILRAREERAKAAEASPQPEEEPVSEPAEPVQAIATPVVDVHATKEEAAKVETDEDAEMQGSQMVFPKLEKESPASSTYQSFSSGSKGKAAYVENEDGVIEHSAAPSVANEPAPALLSPTHEVGFEDLTDDLEVLSADGEQSDDGFHTDEEYDILDASDRETVASP